MGTRLGDTLQAVLQRSVFASYFPNHVFYVPNPCKKKKKMATSVSSSYAPINVMPHLPPPEGGGDKGGDLTDNSDSTHGAFDPSVYYTPRYSYSFYLYCQKSVVVP